MEPGSNKDAEPGRTINKLKDLGRLNEYDVLELSDVGWFTWEAIGKLLVAHREAIISGEIQDEPGRARVAIPPWGACRTVAASASGAADPEHPDDPANPR